MKKKIIIAVLILAIALSVVFAFTLGAGADAAEPSLSIGGKSLVLGNSIYIRYMVAAEGVADISDVSLLVWNEAQENFVKGTEKYEVKWVKGTTVRSGVTYYHFEFEDVAAKRLADDFYAVVYTKVGDKEYYSAPNKYSVLQYAYNMMGKLDKAPSTTEGLIPMLEAMLEYGAKAQYYFDNYRTDRLANADFYQVKTVGGKLADGFTDGLYIAGNEVTVIADAPAEGYYFAGWQNKAGRTVSTDATATITVGTANEVYTAVYEKIETYTVTFIDYNGDVLKTETVEKGTGATAPTTPARDGYAFIGWDKNFDNVTTDITVIAQYKKIATDPTITVEGTTVSEDDGFVNVVVSVSGAPEISSLKFDLSYGDCVKLVEVNVADQFDEYVTLPDASDYESSMQIAFDTEDKAVELDGTFITLRFEIIKDITVDTFANVAIKVIEAIDTDLAAVEFEVVNGAVRIEAEGGSSIILPPDIIG